MATVRIFRLELGKVNRAAALRLMKIVMTETELEAKRIASRGPYATGRLAASIESDGPHALGPTLRGSITAHAPYAKIVHDGAKIHPIFPKGMHAYRFGPGSRRRPQLKFYWRRAGRTVWLPQIPGSRSTVGRSHPGQEGKNFLTDPLRSAARRHRFKVIIFDV